jgi:hypothetical protein
MNGLLCSPFYIIARIHVTVCHTPVKSLAPGTPGHNQPHTTLSLRLLSPLKPLEPYICSLRSKFSIIITNFVKKKKEGVLLISICALRDWRKLNSY